MRLSVPSKMSHDLNYHILPLLPVVRAMPRFPRGIFAASKSHQISSRMLETVQVLQALQYYADDWSQVGAPALVSENPRSTGGSGRLKDSGEGRGKGGPA